jgi:uncharacterized protein YndB with AHSA1/START domain
MESDGIMTGCEGWAYFRVDVPYAANVGSRTEHFNLYWDRPFWMTSPFDPQITQYRDNPSQPHVVQVRTRKIGPLETGDQLSETILGLYVPVTLIPTFLSDAFHNHVSWIVDVVDTAAVGTILMPVQEEPGIADLPFTTGTYVNSTQELVFGALIRPELTVKYWRDVRVEAPWSVGAQIEFIPKGARRPSERGTILEYSPPRLLAYTMKSEPCDDCKETRVTFRLEPEDGRVKLTVTHDRLPEGRGTKAVHDTWREILSSLARVVEAEEHDTHAGTS